MTDKLKILPQRTQRKWVKFVPHRNLMRWMVADGAATAELLERN